MKQIRFELIDGTSYTGMLIGAHKSVAGEVVINTAMNGYPESISDPSYSGQILVFTYPMIGNYGMPYERNQNGLCEYLENHCPYLKGIVIADYYNCIEPLSNNMSLDAWLESRDIPCVCGIDTRVIAQNIREKGCMLGRIIVNDEVEYCNPDLVNQVALVSCKEVIEYGEGEKKIVLVDCGVTHGLLKYLINHGFQVIRVPWNYDFSHINYDGLLISNGPGDPAHCVITEKHIRNAFNIDKPIWGIGMGSLLLARASGAKTYKMKLGHRGQNHPVKDLETNRCFITYQNHGFAIDTMTLGKDWKVLFENINDGSNEGICHISKPFFSTQFYPETDEIGVDTELVFQRFVKLLR